MRPGPALAPAAVLAALAMPAAAQAPALPHVPDNAALRATPVTAFPRVMRDGFHAPGDGGAAIYTASPKPCPDSNGAGDNGAHVASGGGCWVMDAAAIQPNLLQWGAVADDSTDDGPFFQAAYDANVGPIHVPRGVYRIHTQTVFSAATVASFTGDGWAEYPAPSGHAPGCPQVGGIVGTWLHLTAADRDLAPFVWRGGMVGVGSGGFRDMAFCQDHPKPQPGWAPTPYKPVFTLDNIGNETDWQGLYFHAVYDAISDVNSARLHFADIRGQVFHRFLTGPSGYLDGLLDLSDGAGFHFWPYWSTDTNVLAWTERNGVVFDIGRMDGFQVANFFALGYRSCLRLQHSPAGDANALQFGSFACDASVYPVWATGRSAATLTIASAVLDGGDLEPSLAGQDSSCLRSDGGGGSIVRIGNLLCQGSHGSAVAAAAREGGDEIDIGGFTAMNVNCPRSPGPCGPGGSPIFALASSSNGFNLIRLGQTPGLVAINGAKLLDSDIEGHAPGNGIFELPGGYRIAQAIPPGGSTVQMGNFVPRSLLFLTAPGVQPRGGRVSGTVTVALPTAGQDEAAIVADSDIDHLRLSATVGTANLGHCPTRLERGRTLTLQWFNDGAQSGWVCLGDGR